MFNKFFVSLLLLSIFSIQAIAKNTHYVNAKTLKVRLAPTTTSKHMYSIYKGYRVKVYEMKNGWARITRYKAGVVDGKFSQTAKWTHGDFLTKLSTNKAKEKKVLKQARKLTAVDSSKTHYVNAKKLKVRVGPHRSAPHSYNVNKNDQVQVFESVDGWARISQCNEKASRWVFAKYLTELERMKKPKIREAIPKVKKLKPETIQIAQIQQQVPLQAEVQKTMHKVVAEKISEPIQQIKVEKYKIHPTLLTIISESDDFERNKDVFIETSNRLHESGICRIKDFRRTSGWIEISDDVLYFIYCGKIKRSNKIYLNVITGEATK